MDKPIWREVDAGYKLLKQSWLAAIKSSYTKGLGIKVDELDNLMLASFRWMKYIKSYLRQQDVDTSYYYVKTPLLPDAIKAAVDAVTHKHGIVSLYAEAEALESVSRASYRWLKDNDKLVEPDGP
jgi:hypothetical protein